ncbi:MAG: purine-binding chemotaxis protein CheW [Desulfobacterales bacterium]|nr:purine-binding chemotaxis protein CheW [Desulfobacterales bacterium]
MATDKLEEQKNLLQSKDFLQVVTFKLHQEEYGVEITKVKEIIRFEGVTRIPQMPDFIEGVINLRGNVIPVFDLRKRFGLPSDARNDLTRVMVTRMESKIVGLIVDSVSEVMKIPKAQIQPPPDTIAGLAGEYLLGIGKLKDRMIILLDIEKIISATEKKSLSIVSEVGEQAYASS